MSDTNTTVILLNDDQRFFFEGLLSAYIQSKLSSHFRNPRTKRLREYVLIGGPLNPAFQSSAHLLGFTGFHQLMTWIETQYLCRSFYEPRGYHLEVRDYVVGEDEYGDPITTDAIYLVPNGFTGDLPADE
ncbi:MAG: hypothetical protein WBP22_00710 [Candidatus Saccharimonas sp.]